MAEKRMFTQKIIDSDAFLEMPLSAQALYFHLNMRADDDGFINNPKRIQKTVGSTEDDLKLLIAKRFVICFESGVIVIKHWRMHNTLRKDRYNPTQYQEELSHLELKDNNSYTENKSVATTWQPLGNHLATQYSIVESSKEESSINIISDKPVKNKNSIPPTLEEVKSYCFERQNNVDAEKFIDYYTSNGWLVGKNKMKDWKAAVRTWERSVYNNRPQQTNNSQPQQKVFEFRVDGIAESGYEYMVVDGKMYNRWGKELNSKGYEIVDFGLEKGL